MKKFNWLFVLMLFALNNLSYAQDAASETPEQDELPQITKEYKEAVLKLFDVNGYRQELEMGFKSISSRVFLYFNDISEEEISEISKKFNIDELLDKQCRVYAKIFTIDEVNELIKIFSNPVTKKLNELGEGLSGGLFANENKFFDELRFLIADEIAKKGYELPENLQRPKPESDEEQK